MEELFDAAEAWLRRAAGEPLPDESEQVARGGSDLDCSDANDVGEDAATAVGAARGSSEEGGEAEAPAALAATPAPLEASAPEEAPGPEAAAAPLLALDLTEVKPSLWEAVPTKPRKTPRGSGGASPRDGAQSAATAVSSPDSHSASPSKRVGLGQTGRGVAAALLLAKRRPASAREPKSSAKANPLADAVPRPSTARESRSPHKRQPIAGGAPSPSRSPLRPAGANRMLEPSAGSQPGSPAKSPSKMGTAAAGGLGGLGGGGDGGGGSAQQQAASIFSSISFGEGGGSRPYFGDRPSAPYRDAFKRKPKGSGSSAPARPSPSTFIHPNVTPLSTVKAAAVIVGEVDVDYYAANHADIAMVPVAEVMRQRAQAIGLIDSPEEEWDAPVRVMTESLGEVLGMDWPKYAAAVSSDEPTAEHRLRLKINRLDALVVDASDDAGGGGGGEWTEDREMEDAEARAPSSAGVGGLSAHRRLSKEQMSHRGEQKQRPGDSARAPHSPRASPRGASPRSGGGGGGGTSRGKPRGGGSAPPTARSTGSGAPSARAAGKKTYTRDGKLIDTSMRSAAEAALIERVQGHATLAPPTMQHPSIAKCATPLVSALSQLHSRLARPSRATLGIPTASNAYSPLSTLHSRLPPRTLHSYPTQVRCR